MAASPRGLRLLSLDGGGVKGLSELLILERLMYVLKEESATYTTLPKPCEVFDIICGTSTGGLIAILLGRLKLSVREAIVEYERLSKEIFGAPKSKMPGREAKYSATNFETVIKKLVKKHTGDEDTLLASADEVCKVFVCAQPALNPDTSHPFIMRSFEGYSPLENLTIWQAARATSAAPTFFKQLVIGNHQFIDGGLGSNNPCRVLLKECQQIYRKKPGCTVSCIISIGSGMPKNIGISELNGIGFSWLRDVVKTLSGMATDCEAINEEVAAWFKATPNVYFRFNVEQGLQDVEMDRHEKLNVIIAKTEGYLDKDSQQEKLKQAAKVLAIEDRGLCLITDLVPILNNAAHSTIFPNFRELSQSPPLTKQFFGRRDVLENLRTALSAQKEVDRRIVIWGFPGSGKTSIALRYIQESKQYYSAVIWINALTQQTIERSLAEAADSIVAMTHNHEKAASSNHLRTVNQWLQETREQWLLVVDSVDDLEEPNVLKLLPECNRGAILITSSKSDPGKLWGISQGIALEALGEAAGVDLLFSKLKSTHYPSREKAIKVVTALHGLPLAIEHAAVALRRRFSIEDLQRIIDDEAKLPLVLAKKPSTNEWAYSKNKPLYAILEHLAVQLIRDDPIAASIFTWLSCLGPGEISQHALLPFGSVPNQGTISSRELWKQMVHGVTGLSELSFHLADASCEPMILWESIRLLEDSCMLTIREESKDKIPSILLHNTIQKWALTRVTETERHHVICFSAHILGQSLKGLQAAAMPLVFQHDLNLTVQNVATKFEKYLRPALQSGGHQELLHVWRGSAYWLGRHLVTMKKFTESHDILKMLIEYDKTMQESRWPRDEASRVLLEDLGDCHNHAGHFQAAIEVYKYLLHQCQIAEDCAPLVDARIRHKLQAVGKRQSVHSSWQQRGFGLLNPQDLIVAGQATIPDEDSEAMQYGLSSYFPWTWSWRMVTLGNQFSVPDRKLLWRAASLGQLDLLKLILRYHTAEAIPSDTLEHLLKRTKFSEADLHYDRIKLLLDLGAPIKTTSEYRLSPLEMALNGSNSLRTVRLLLSYGANPNVGRRYGLLDMADGKLYSAPKVTLLLEYGMSFTFYENLYGRPPLVDAASSGDTERVRILLRRGVVPDAVGGAKRTSLTYAAEGGHIDMVRMLLNFGANPNPQNSDESIPLSLAEAQGHTEVVDLLLESGAEITGVSCAVLESSTPQSDRSEWFNAEEH